MSESEIIPESIRDKLNCSICLEIFRVPLTLPCGHNFCQPCIHGHWDREAASMVAITCPVCREPFKERPEPMKNVTINALVDQLKDEEKKRQKGSPMRLETKAGVLEATCPRHHRVLNLFCCTEKKCVCVECSVTGCRGHQLELTENERRREEARLSAVLHNNSCNREQTGAEIMKLDHLIQNIKESCNKRVSGISNQFERLATALDECRTLAIESIRKEERAAVEQAVRNRDHLQRHMEALHKQKKEAEELLLSTDDITFLQGLPLLVPPGSIPLLASVPSCGTSQVDAVTTILPEVFRLLKTELPNALYPAMPEATDEDPKGSPSPERPRAKQRGHALIMSEHRKRLHKDYRNLSFDAKSSNKYIQLSRQNYKASHKACLTGKPVSDLTERFQNWQVMCTEGFSEGHHYWEVEISDFFVQLGVTYSHLARSKGEEHKIGRNPFSWCLQVQRANHSAWHNNQEQRLQPPNYLTIGISLDCTAGKLSFYGVKDGRLDLIHSFTCIFTDTLYPIFWIGEGASVLLRQTQDNSDVVQRVLDMSISPGQV
ncbi:tripartite motif-containing protein 65 [Spea bombifrons]|uniref:tripartite motif-containing protein 65 n=1 Tax=Spea bombifrons TaxID=233779 RepID=UPI0023499F1D|nr:tripartite motif-containing protein 65 [Spea bombifrons]